MSHTHAEQAKQIILEEFGEHYPVQYPDGRSGEVLAKIDRVDKGRRVYRTALISEPLPEGAFIIVDDEPFELTRQRQGNCSVALSLVKQVPHKDYSEYGRD